mmetsp:Transcript_2964/g.7493  ORF Transcript_2964/g.7493 Transcript_2964/m.7493 type:complete len:272 (+) Transcript_2964:78-893(+)
MLSASSAKAQTAATPTKSPAGKTGQMGEAPSTGPRRKSMAPMVRTRTHPVIIPPPPTLPEELLQRAKAAFLERDTDGSGYLDSEELISLVRSLGHDVSMHRMQELLQPYDADGDGCLDLREFIHMLASNMARLEDKIEDELHTDALIDILIPPDAAPPPSGAAVGWSSSVAPSGGNAEASGSSASGLARTASLSATQTSIASSSSLAHRSGDTVVPTAKIKELEQRMLNDFGLTVKITDHLHSPVTLAKLKKFLLAEFQLDSSISTTFPQQ